MKNNRNFLKNFSVITIIFTMLSMIVLPNISRASKKSTSVWLKLVQPRNDCINGINYSIGDGTFDGNQDPAVAVDSTNGHRLWNVIQVDKNSGTYIDKNLYCMNADIDGFGTLESEGNWYWSDRTSTASDAVEFTTTYDLKADKETVLNTVFSDTNISTVSTNYNKILALLDIIYDPEDNTYGPNYKKTLLEAAGLNENDLDDGAISALQQAAMWYYTNHNSDIFINTYDNLDSNNPMASWLYTGTGKGLKYGSDVSQAYSQANSDLQSKAGKFYKYLISTANANASKYEGVSDPSNVSLPITVTEKSGITLEETTDGYIYGPLHVTKNNEFDYTVENFQVTKEGGTIVSYSFLNSNKQAVSNASLKSFENKDFYVKVNTTDLDEVNVAFSVKYNSTQATLFTKDRSETTLQPVVLIKRNQTSKPFSFSKARNKKFDLALRKYITAVNGNPLTGDYVRNLTNIDLTPLTNGGNETTAAYKHTKKPVKVETNDVVTYTIKLYNEGEERGTVTSIIDKLPTGVEPVAKTGTVTSRKGIVYNYNYNEDLNVYTIGCLRGTNTNGKELAAFNGQTLDYDEISFDCKVTAKASTAGDKILTNIAYIYGAYNEDKNVPIMNAGGDRDSEPLTTPKLDGDVTPTKDNMEDYHGSGKSTLDDPNYFYTGRQDDDDFEKLLIEQVVPEGNYSINIIKVDSEDDTPLSGAVFTVNGTDKTATNENGTTIIENKKAITAENQTITYTIEEKTAPNGYNKFDGTITLNVKTKRQEDKYLLDTAATTMVVKDANGKEISDSPVEIDKKTNSITLKVKDVKIEGNYKIDLVKEDAEGEQLSDPATFEVTNKQTNTTVEKTTHNSKLSVTDGAVEITEDSVSTPDQYVIKETVPPDDYCKFDGIITITVNKKEENGKYVIDGTPSYTVTDEEGNDLTEKTGDTVTVEVKNGNIYVYVKNYQFDLALRKFIAQVNDTELKNTDGKAYLREPEVDTSKLNTVDENGNKVTTAIYNHPKTPVEVKKGDTVIYILRVYNEGDMDGYATEITDHLPDYLEFVKGDFNTRYKWDVSEDGRTVKSTYLENQLIAKATKNSDGKIVLSYKDLPIMCKVKDTAKTQEAITNIADITKFTDKDKKEIEDRDSSKDNVELPSDKELPNYKENEKGTYVPGQEDDDDFEKVIIYEFDLALRKWVTQAIVIENGEETVTETGHDAWDDPEEVVKVELHRKKLDSVTVKFRYSIRVYNQGDVEGYAKEITDYIPEGLKFDPEDNKGWVDEGNNIISTRLLEDTLLKPGEYADVEVVLTWINGKDNVGLKINTAEISEDFNDKGLPDKDSTPDNRVPGEDDIDDAPVILSIETGREVVYVGLGLGILVTLGAGIYLIRKFVL